MMERIKPYECWEVIKKTVLSIGGTGDENEPTKKQVDIPIGQKCMEQVSHMNPTHNVVLDKMEVM
ncbi:MAG: hypothetical protein R3A45_08195 [Bdellovibrionota bacterium]